MVMVSKKWSVNLNRFIGPTLLESSSAGVADPIVDGVQCEGMLNDLFSYNHFFEFPIFSGVFVTGCLEMVHQYS